MIHTWNDQASYVCYLDTNLINYLFPHLQEVSFQFQALGADWVTESDLINQKHQEAWKTPNTAKMFNLLVESRS